MRATAALLALPALLPGAPSELEPAPLAWEELSPARFDLFWRLPEVALPGRDLVAEMERLCALRFAVPDPGDPAGQGTLRTFGDLAAAASALEPAARRAWLDGLARTAPRLYGDWGAGLEQLLLDGRLRSPDWDPDEDDPRDGILTADPWELGASAAGRGGPWRGVGAVLHQAATLMRADLATIKAAENDYRRYPEDVGAAYEEIAPLPGSYFRGEDPAGHAFATLAVRVRADLPFPFGGYALELHMLHRIDGRGRPVTDLYGVGDDFHWLAGRDVYLPVDTSDGRRVGWLVVRLYGFDLAGVPDGASERRAALRGSLGNLRRRAEAGGPTQPFPRPRGPTDVPPFQVRGPG